MSSRADGRVARCVDHTGMFTGVKWLGRFWQEIVYNLPMAEKQMVGRRLAVERSMGRCEVCGGSLNDWYGASVHHRRPRGMGGSRDPATNAASNLIVLCGSGTTGCHGDIERNRVRSRRNGLIVGSRMKPIEIPVLLRGEWWLLTDDGCKVPSDPPE